MYCQNCGTKLTAESNFCSVCGLEANKIPETPKKDLHPLIGLPASLFGVFIGVSLSHYLGIFGLLFLVTFFGGFWFVKWYMDRGGIKIKIINRLVYVNWIAWFIPVIGYFFGALAIAFSKRIPAKKKTYLIFGIVGLIISTINAYLGYLGIFN